MKMAVRMIIFLLAIPYAIGLLNTWLAAKFCAWMDNAMDCPMLDVMETGLVAAGWLGAVLMVPGMVTFVVLELPASGYKAKN